jgi:hypothetical protein
MALVFATSTIAADAQVLPPPADPEIVTDRPDITESSIVVPKGSLQFENGLTWTGDNGQATLDLPETLVRFGVSDRTELRIVVPNYFEGLTGPTGASGFGDVAVGMKQQLGPLPGGVDLSVIVALSLPTGADQISSHGYAVPWVISVRNRSPPKGTFRCPSYPPGPEGRQPPYRRIRRDPSGPQAR